MCSGTGWSRCVGGRIPRGSSGPGSSSDDSEHISPCSGWHPLMRQQWRRTVDAALTAAGGDPAGTPPWNPSAHDEGPPNRLATIGLDSHPDAQRRASQGVAHGGLPLLPHRTRTAPRSFRHARGGASKDCRPAGEPARLPSRDRGLILRSPCGKAGFVDPGLPVERGRPVDILRGAQARQVPEDVRALQRPVPHVPRRSGNRADASTGRVP